jgi:GNAT superfamily N-acetyltransferase
MGGSDITLRAAQDKDGPALAELAIMAAHGVMNLLYEGLIFGHSVAEAINERRLRNPASFCALQHWRVAEDAQGRVLGGLNSLPNVELAKSVSGIAGRALMLEAERLAQQSGLRAIGLTTFEADAGLIAFYSKLGFTIRERRSIPPHPMFEFPATGC